MARKESAVATSIQRLLDARSCWYIKTTGVSKVGCPDLIACYKGRFLAIEMKREKDGAYGTTKKQELELHRIVTAGGYAFVASSADEVAKVLALIDADI